MELNRENAKKVDVFLPTIEDTVKYLIECRNKGESICLDFNGVNGVETLYSTDVTLENAYLQITGLTYEEAKNVQRELSEAKNEEQKNLFLKNMKK